MQLENPRDYQDEIERLNLTIREQAQKNRSLEAIIRECLRLLAVVPDDLLSRLEQVGFNVTDSSIEKADSSIEKPISSIATASHSKQTTPEAVKDEPVEITKAACRKNKTKVLPKAQPVIKKQEPKMTVEKSVVDGVYVSRSGRRCKRKIMHDESDPDEQTRKKSKVVDKKSPTIELNTSDDNVETESDRGNSDTEEPATEYLRNKPRKKCAKKFHKSEVKTKQMQPAGSEKNDVTFPCTFRKCDVICSNEDDVLKHIEEKHAENKSRRCQKCKRMFVTPDLKRRHTKLCIERLSKVGPFVCEICGKTDIPDPAKLKEHIRNHQARSDEQERKRSGMPPKYKTVSEKSPCEICGKLVLRRSMRLHLSTHTKPFMCELCEKPFSVQTLLQTHKIRVHQDESVAKYKCHHCGMLFINLTQCQCHVNAIHNKDYSNKCGTCGKAFPSDKLLQVHVKVVHAEKTFQCHLCSSAFGMKTQLNQHIRTVHIKQVTYPCSVCKERFPNMPEVYAHKKLAHADKLAPHQCQFCGNKFQKRNRYRRHLRNVHNAETVILDNREIKIVDEDEAVVELGASIILERSNEIIVSV